MQPLVFLQRHAIYWLFIFVILFACCYSGQAQANPEADRKVTLSATQISLKDVFKAIRKQTGLAVFFSNYTTDIQLKEKVNVNFDKTPLDEVMRFLLRDKKNHSFRFSNDAVIIFKEDVTPKSFSPQKDMEDTTSTRFSLSGKVTDAEGKPIYGATVVVRGTRDGATTDSDGNFSLPNVVANAKLLVSSIGYETRELPVKGRTILAQLNIAVNELDETVVIAYGTTTRRMSTGNVVSVKSKDIEKQPINNPLLALQGRVPGLVIEQAGGIPGSGVTVRIQGQNSLSMGNDPLIVIDGIPYPSQMLPTVNGILGSSGSTMPAPLGSNGSISGNPLSYINPTDIESIDILKDADATSIYGSRAAAGAILITTKKGKAGPTRVDVNFQRGWGTVTRKLDLLDTQQYLKMRHQAKINDNREILETDYDINGTWDTTRYTDWQKELIGKTASYMDARATISGGTPNTKFLVSGGYHRETTVFPGDLADQKGSLHFNLNNISMNGKFEIQLSGSYLNDNNRIMNFDLTQYAVRLAPNAPPLYNSDGTLNWAPLPDGNSTWDNPLAYLNQKYQLNTKNLITNLLLSYQILPGLHVKSTFGYTDLQTEETSIYPNSSLLPEIRPFATGLSLFGNGAIRTWQIEPQLTYSRTLGKGSITALFGTTILKTSSKRQAFDASGYNNDAVLEDIRAASTVTVSSTTASLYRYAALFGRVTYNLQNKYILNITARRDGSSRFGPENLFHNFGSIGGAWIFSDEVFMQEASNFLSFGKLRASYGTTGNDQIGDYSFMNLYESRPQSNNYQGIIGLTPVNLPNPYLEWEETKKLQVGIDLGFFKDRILLSGNYYYNRSSNQLQSYGLPYIAGFNSITQNFPATIQNFGWELTVSGSYIDNAKFSWKSNLNLTIPKNKLVKFPNIETSTVSDFLVVGEPITISRLYNFGGVDPSTGLYQFLDKEGKLSSDPGSGVENKTIIINTAPKYYGGFQNTFRYKGLELDFLFQFFKQLGPNYYFGDRPGRFFGTSNIANQPTFVLDAWSKNGDNVSHQKFSTTYPSVIRNAYNYATQSNYAWTDASYVRLKNLSLSWQIPKSLTSKAHLENGRVYLQSQNLFTITNYKGMDPETKSSITLPPLRVITVGVHVVL